MEARVQKGVVLEELERVEMDYSVGAEMLHVQEREGVLSVDLG